MSNNLHDLVDSELNKLPKVSGGRQPGIGSDLQKVFDAAAEAAESLKDEFVSTEHLLLGLARTDNKASNLLKLSGVTEQDVLKAMSEVRGSARVTDQNAEDTYQALQKYGIDLTELASQGKLDPVIGRDTEIRRVIQVLSRRTKNNPVLIGQPGVGKTAIAEGLGTADLRRRCAAKSETETRHLVGYGCVGCRGKVSRRFRGTTQSRATRSQGLRRPGDFVHR